VIVPGPRIGADGRRNVRNSEYRALYEPLSERLKQQAEDAFEMFLVNPAHPSLRRHGLTDTGKGKHRSGSISVSISIRYRVIYWIDGDVNVWYWIG